MLAQSKVTMRSHSPRMFCFTQCLDMIIILPLLLFSTPVWKIIYVTLGLDNQRRFFSRWLLFYGFSICWMPVHCSRPSPCPLLCDRINSFTSSPSGSWVLTFIHFSPARHWASSPRAMLYSGYLPEQVLDTADS